MIIYPRADLVLKVCLGETNVFISNLSKNAETRVGSVQGSAGRLVVRKKTAVLHPLSK